MDEMKQAKKHPLAETQYDINFIHSEHGEVIMSAAINTLNGGWCWWYDISNSMSCGTKRDVNRILKGIRSKTKVLKDTFWK